MAGKLTWEQIRQAYPDEWVVLTDYGFDENEDLTEGVVYAHGRDRADVYGRLRQGERPNPVAVRFTGEVRGGMIGFYAEDLDKED